MPAEQNPTKNLVRISCKMEAYGLSEIRALIASGADVDMKNR